MHDYSCIGARRGDPFKMLGEFCPDCGFKSRPTDSFCRGCGTPRNDAARSASPIAVAEALVESGLLDEAIVTVQLALGETETAELQVALATLYLRRGGSSDAARALERALAIDGQCAIAHAYIGGLLLHTGDVDGALERLDRARDLAPGDVIVAMKRAEFWMRLGILTNARSELRRGLQSGGGAPHVREMAQAMLIAVEKRSRNTFTRNPARLPSFAGMARLFRRGGEPKAQPVEPEVQPWP